MNLLLQLSLIDWEMVSALAAWAEILIILVPAVFCFFYFKMNFVNYWVFEQTSNGLKVAVHNKTRSSLFILHQELCVKNYRSKEKRRIPIKMNNKIKNICIKPDEVIYITIDYGIYGISPSEKIVLHIQFAGKTCLRKKKIKRGNKKPCS